MSLTNFLKPALAALVVCAAVESAEAAVPSATFSLDLGKAFGLHRIAPKVLPKFGAADYYRYCATDTQLKQLFLPEGYGQIHAIKVENSSNRVWFSALFDKSAYQLRVDRCTGRVDHVHRPAVASAPMITKGPVVAGDRRGGGRGG